MRERERERAKECMCKGEREREREREREIICVTQHVLCWCYINAHTCAFVYALSVTGCTR